MSTLSRSMVAGWRMLRPIPPLTAASCRIASGRTRDTWVTHARTSRRSQWAWLLNVHSTPGYWPRV
jgi:hypothetical protein